MLPARIKNNNKDEVLEALVFTIIVCDVFMDGVLVKQHSEQNLMLSTKFSAIINEVGMPILPSAQ